MRHRNADDQTTIDTAMLTIKRPSVASLRPFHDARSNFVAKLHRRERPFPKIIEGFTKRLRPLMGWLVPFFAPRCNGSPPIISVGPRAGYLTCARCQRRRTLVLVYRLGLKSGCPRDWDPAKYSHKEGEAGEGVVPDPPKATAAGTNSSLISIRIGVPGSKRTWW